MPSAAASSPLRLGGAWRPISLRAAYLRQNDGAQDAGKHQANYGSGVAGDKPTNKTDPDRHRKYDQRAELELVRHAEPQRCLTGNAGCTGAPSTGPRTEAGKAAIRASRTKHGRYSQSVIESRRESRALLRLIRDLIGNP